VDDHIIQLDDELIDDNQNFVESFDNDNNKENVNERDKVVDKKRYVSYYCCYCSSTFHFRCFYHVFAGKKAVSAIPVGLKCETRYSC
jgi:hypothetical protein